MTQLSNAKESFWTLQASLHGSWWAKDLDSEIFGKIENTSLTYTQMGKRMRGEALHSQVLCTQGAVELYGIQWHQFKK